jgi:poly-gamma-glutamate capsule biosynthesis protein CapA/YwtB (metallophosphatase superfamily)
MKSGHDEKKLLRLSRRGVIAGAFGVAMLPRPSRAAGELRLTVMGQALIQHDLREHPWPDFSALATLFGKADLCFTDLETAIHSVKAEAPIRQDVFLHAADPVVLDCLKDWHIGLLATSNNHAFDLGTGGIVGALDELDKRGLAHAGTGTNLMGAAAPAFSATANGTVARIAGASGQIRDGGAATATRAGVNELRWDAGGDPAASLNNDDVERMLGSIRNAATRADVVIAYHHNHVLTDKGHSVPQWQREFAHRCIDAGATLFVSHGAPWLLGIELYQHRPIFYDLGSLVFQTATEGGTYDASAWQSVIAECRFASGMLTEMTLTPVQLTAEGIDGDLATRGRPSLARGTDATEILDHLAALSAPFGTKISRSGETATIHPT